jgi:hypothetical protein
VALALTANKKMVAAQFTPTTTTTTSLWKFDGCAVPATVNGTEHTSLSEEQPIYHQKHIVNLPRGSKASANEKRIA